VGAGPVIETENLVVVASGPVWYVPEQVLPLHPILSGVGVSLLLEWSTHDVLLLLGPLYLRVTDWPPRMFVRDALRVTGTMVSVAVTGADVVKPDLAVA